jgi:hypothetical protein
MYKSCFLKNLIILLLCFNNILNQNLGMGCFSKKNIRFYYQLKKNTNDTIIINLVTRQYNGIFLIKKGWFSYLIK